MIVYKYRGNSTFTNQIFTEKTIWLAKSSTLNDPCECTLHSLAPEWVAKNVRDLKATQMAGFLMNFPYHMPEHPAAAEIRQKLQGVNDFDEKYRLFRTMYEERVPSRLSDPAKLFSGVEEQLRDIGVFSLSETAEQPLMWAHYAGNHEGVCLGFEVKEGAPIWDRDHFIRVTYSDAVPEMPQQGFIHETSFAMDEEGRLAATSQFSLTDETIRKAIGTKSTDWAYEREWRYVQRASGKYPFPGPLVELVFGVRCSETQRKQYVELVSAHLSNEVRLYEMKRIPDSLSFERVFLGTCTSKLIVVDSGKSAAQRSIDETSIADSHPVIQRDMELGRYEQAFPAISKALELQPNSYKLWRTKGVILGFWQRHSEALSCFQRAAELRPDFFSAWYHCGVAGMALQHYDDAISAFEKAHTLNSSDASTLFNLGSLLAHKNRLRDAEERLLAAEQAGHPRARDLLNEIERMKKHEDEESDEA